MIVVGHSYPPLATQNTTYDRVMIHFYPFVGREIPVCSHGSSRILCHTLKIMSCLLGSNLSLISLIQTFKMTNQCPESECFFQNILRHVDRHELNAECQQWALAHGKCVDFNALLSTVLLLLLPRIVVKVLCSVASDQTRPLILMSFLTRSRSIHHRIQRKNTHEPVECSMESTNWSIAWRLTST